MPLRVERQAQPDLTVASRKPLEFARTLAITRRQLPAAAREAPTSFTLPAEPQPACSSPSSPPSVAVDRSAGLAERWAMEDEIVQIDIVLGC